MEVEDVFFSDYPDTVTLTSTNSSNYDEDFLGIYSQINQSGNARPIWKKDNSDIYIIYNSNLF